jgi:hypothetical protein
METANKGHGKDAVPPAYSGALLKITDLVNADRAPDDLRRYLHRPGGSQLERLADYGAPDEFTDNDFRAVQALSVSTLRSARQWLREQVRCLLQAAARFAWSRSAARVHRPHPGRRAFERVPGLVDKTSTGR